MRILLFLIALSTAALGQIQVIPGAGSSGSTRPIITNLQNITINVNPNQYIGTDVSMTSYTNGVGVTSWKWRILHRYFHNSGRVDTLLHRTSSVQNPTFSLDSTGFYDVQLTARNSVDKYFVYETRLFVVMQPRFTEGEADLVVNLSTGPKFYDFRALGDKPDYKIYLKGQNVSAYLEFVSLHGTEGHPVRIQKSNDNVQVQFSYSNGSAHPWYFSQTDSSAAASHGARYIIVDGFNLDGTPGIKVTAGAVSTSTIRVEGKITDVAFYGVEVQSNPLTIDGAAIAIVPTVSSTCQFSNWAINNIHIWHCVGTGGEEFAYVNESSQAPDYVGNNGKVPPNGIGLVMSRNRVDGAGRDGLQAGSCSGEAQDNDVSNIGQQSDPGGQESCFVSNPGSAIKWSRNSCKNAKMGANVISGLKPWAPLAGQTTPQPTIFENNTFSNGTFPSATPDEPFMIYIQNNPGSGAGNWTVEFKNNVIDTNKKCAEFLLALGGFTSYNYVFANNVIIKSGTAGDTPEMNFTGNGKATLQAGTKTINNIVRERGSDLSNLYFYNYSTHNFTITNLSSAVYSGSPTNTGSNSYDKLGFPSPLPVIGYYFGPYGSYNKRSNTP